MFRRKARVRGPREASTRGGYLAAACWLGLVMGLLELALLLGDRLRNNVSMIGALRLNRHYPWMIPASHLAIFAACGLALELTRQVLPGLIRRLAPMALGALAFLSLLLTIRELDTIACVLLAGGLTAQVVPRLRRFAPAFRKVVGVSLPVLLVAMALMVVGRHAHFAILERRAEAKPVAQGSPNVLFLVMDTVRAGSLSLHGYPRPTTPRLARLAARGVRFDEARSAAPWTLPSHATMFTGRWPSELFEGPEEGLDDTYPTLAEFLGESGYATAGFVANTYYCNSGFGLGRGFDHYEDFYETFDTTPSEVLRHSVIGRRLVELIGDEEAVRPDGRKDADRVNADFLDWLESRRGRPFFAFLNYFDAHAPYLAPEATGRRFGLLPVTPEDNQVLASWQKLSSPPDDPRALELARDAYDDCIGYLDAALGRLFDELERRGVLENTLIVVTSDHGEEIGEHRLIGHGRSLYREELHVPLVIVKPGRVPSGQVVSEPVSLRDLPSTVVDLLGLSARSPFPGRSMAGLWAGGPGAARPRAGSVRSEVALRLKPTPKKDRPPALRGPMTSVVSEGLSYIRNADGSEELYRLADDPGESRNLAESEPDRPTLERLRDLADAPTGGPASGSP